MSLLATSPWASCSRALAVGPSHPAAADPSLHYRRVFHWSIRQGLGQVPGIDQHHLRTWPDLHAVHDRVDTLVHAGIGKAEIIILSVPDSLLVGASNEKLVRHVRSLNSTAKIVASADFLANVDDL